MLVCFVLLNLKYINEKKGLFWPYNAELANSFFLVYFGNVLLLIKMNYVTCMYYKVTYVKLRAKIYPPRENSTSILEPGPSM